MSDNFELLEIGQIEIMHQQTHDRLNEEGADCRVLGKQHDSLAAELVSRGIAHDTEVICLESELAQKAPNYRRGFTGDVCTQCAFGQLFPFCNLYKANYVSGDTCDSFRYFEVLELEPPHGFLMAQEKQTAIATVNDIDSKSKKTVNDIDTSKSYLIVSNGEAFGIAELEEPAQVKIKEFDSESWLNQHRVTQRERRQWWPDSEVFYVYRLKSWKPFEGVKLYEDGHVIDEPKLTAKQWRLVSKAKELPKQIILKEDLVSVVSDKEFVLTDQFYRLPGLLKTNDVSEILKAAYGVNKHTIIHEQDNIKETIALYSLALVRNPRMRVSKKSQKVVGGIVPNDNLMVAKPEGEFIINNGKKQEGETMPFAVVLKDGEYCVINTDTDESRGCHKTEPEAEAQLAALRINVEEGENAIHNDKLKKRKPRKKDLFGSEQSIDQQLNFIRRQFEDQFNSSSNDVVAQPSENYVWVNDIFDSFIIADEEGRLFRVDYMMFEDEVIFSPKERWVEVERGYLPKGFKRVAADLEPLKKIKTQPKTKKPPFIERLKMAAKTILEVVSLAEDERKEIKETDILARNYNIRQKDVNGELWHFTWSTNAFKDREKEIFSTNSLKRYVERAIEKRERGFFNLWHIQGTDFAKKEWQMVIGRFLVEAGPYLKDEKGQAAKEFFRQFGEGHPEFAPEGWGCSPEYKYLPEERATGIYENIWITRTSTLPKMAAANLWTETSQLTRSKMAITDYSEDQIKTAIEVFKDEDFVKSLITIGETKTAELEAANVAHKENKQDEPVKVELNIEDLAVEVGKQFGANLEPMAEAIATLTMGLNELKEWKEQQDKAQGIKDKTEMPSFVYEMKRASGDKATVVTEDDDLKGAKPKEAQAGKGDAWARTFS